jgi:glucose/arabinose dehydrogenase
MGGAKVADIASEKILLEWDDPQANHNGGTLAFGPDGYLYIAIGDGGGADDVDPGHVPDWYTVNEGGNGQDIEANLFGNILRIDVNTASGSNAYGIPSDNPFVDKTGLDEIYAYGFRNPYRMSFDMGGTKQLFVGDAGQSLYEEIDVVTKGGNYGWNVKEGTHCFSTADDTKTLSSCPAVDVLGNALIDPVIEVNNASNPAGGKAATIIGGNVYRGSAIPEYQGAYIFGTFAQKGDKADGELFLSHPGGSGMWSYEEIALKSSNDDLGYYLKGFGQDNTGEIYLTVSGMAGPSGNTGKVLKLVRAQ